MPALDNLPEFGDRFWYWQGASGKRYIHSVYTPENCPPLPGAIFVAVHRFGDGRRMALSTGRFDEHFGYPAGQAFAVKPPLGRVDEIHVHLLASDYEEADTILSDIDNAISRSRIDGGFHEAPASPQVIQSELFAA